MIDFKPTIKKILENEIPNIGFPHSNFMASYDYLMKGKVPYHAKEKEYFSQIFSILNKEDQCIIFNVLPQATERQIKMLGWFIRRFIHIFRCDLKLINTHDIYLQSVDRDSLFDYLRFALCWCAQDMKGELPKSHAHDKYLEFTGKASWDEKDMKIQAMIMFVSSLRQIEPLRKTL